MNFTNQNVTIIIKYNASSLTTICTFETCAGLFSVESAEICRKAEYNTYTR